MNINTITPEALKTKTIEELHNDLHAPHDGLTSEEASARLQKFGRNEIVEMKARPLLKFLKSFPLLLRYCHRS